MDLKDSVTISAAALKAQGTRVRVIAENVANSDSTAITPGGDPYRRKTIAFRDVMDRRAVATKDIDLLLRPSVDAVSTAETLGAKLLAHRWSPHYPDGVLPATADTPDHALPALRLRPPEGDGQWFVELLAEPPAWQGDRKYWRRFETSSGTFGLHGSRALAGARRT